MAYRKDLCCLVNEITGYTTTIYTDKLGHWYYGRRIRLLSR